jgi:hypothetical protein
MLISLWWDSVYVNGRAFIKNTWEEKIDVRKEYSDIRTTIREWVCSSWSTIKINNTICSFIYKYRAIRS